MLRFIFCLTLIAVTSCNAYAKDNDDKFVDVSLSDLSQFSAHYNIFDLKDPTTFAEYAKVTECEAFKAIGDSPFKQQEMQQAVFKHISLTQNKVPELFLRLPIVLQVSGYNFDTQSLPIIEESQFKRVNVLELTQHRVPLCTRETTGNFVKLPVRYMAKLNFPISLYRIPLQRDLAESVFKKLDHNATIADVRILYGYMLVQIETIQPELQTENTPAKAIVRGQVNAINLYMDQDRKILFKRLDYSENF